MVAAVEVTAGGGGAWRRVGWFCDDRLVRTGRGGPDLQVGVKGRVAGDFSGGVV